MKKFVHFFLLIIAFSAFATEETPNAAEEKPCIYVLLVANTLDTGIGKSDKVDIERLAKSLKVVARRINYEIKLVTLKDYDASVDALIESLTAIHASSNDIVFFAYTGHGAKDSKGSIWPVIEPPISDTSGVRGASIIDYLLQGKQRLTCIFFDCCNFSTTGVTDEEMAVKSTPPLVLSYKLPGIKKLFLGYKGHVVATSSRRNEYSHSQIRRPYGGYFITGVLRGMTRFCAKKSDSSWYGVKKVANKYTIKTAKSEDNEKQHPYWMIKLSSSGYPHDHQKHHHNSKKPHSEKRQARLNKDPYASLR